MSAPRAVPRPHWTETEDQFLGWVIDRAHLSDWLVAHQRPGRTVHGWRTAWQADGNGFPDLVLVRDRVIFAELKSDRGRPRVEQQIWHVQLTDAGQEVYTWRPRDRDLITEILK